MKILKNENAIISPIINTMISLVIIILCYAFLVPIIYFIGDALIAIGAPSENVLLYRHYMIVGFMIFAAAVFIILAAKIYHKTHDTGVDDVYRGYR